MELADYEFIATAYFIQISSAMFEWVHYKFYNVLFAYIFFIHLYSRNSLYYVKRITLYTA